MSGNQDVTYLAIRASIVDGEVGPGDELSTSDLSLRLGVSRTPVSAALARLVEDGLVEKIARTHRVRQRSVRELIDVFDARIALESAAARLAAERCVPGDLAQLDYVTEVARTETDLAAQDRLNTLWHHTLVDAAQNQTIADLLHQLRTQLAIYRPIQSSRRTRESAEVERVEHQAIVEAVRAGDPSLAHSLTAAHLSHGRDVRLRGLDEVDMLSRP